jgi:DNA-binding NarL/FixJ family response regulator
LRPEVVLLDADLPRTGGIACLADLRAAHPRVKVVMCSMSTDRALIETSLVGGACGYIVEKITVGDLPAAIRQAVAATSLVPAPAVAVVEERRPVGSLTAREADVLHAVARGLSNKAIAAELRLTVRTVKFHLTSIYRKLRVTNRTEAARWALRQGTSE